MLESESPLSRMRWRVSLRGGMQIIIVADGTYLDGTDRVFECAVGSRPVTLHEVARVPEEAIDDFESFVDRPECEE